MPPQTGNILNGGRPDSNRVPATIGATRCFATATSFTPGADLKLRATAASMAPRCGNLSVAKACKSLEATIRAGWPGRGVDPTARFTDLQWYLFHQQNVVY